MPITLEYVSALFRCDYNSCPVGHIVARMDGKDIVLARMNTAAAELLAGLPSEYPVFSPDFAARIRQTLSETTPSNMRSFKFSFPSTGRPVSCFVRVNVLSRGVENLAMSPIADGDVVWLCIDLMAEPVFTHSSTPIMTMSSDAFTEFPSSIVCLLQDLRYCALIHMAEEMKYLFVNAAGEELLGRSYREVLSCRPGDFTPFPTKTMGALANWTAKGKESSFDDWKILHSSGEVMRCSLTAIPVAGKFIQTCMRRHPDAGPGDPASTLASASASSATPATACSASHAAPGATLTTSFEEQMEAREAALINHAPDAILLLHPGTQSVIQSNPMSHKIFKRTRVEFLSMTSDVLLTHIPVELPPNELASPVPLAVNDAGADGGAGAGVDADSRMGVGVAPEEEIDTGAFSRGMEQGQPQSQSPGFWESAAAVLGGADAVTLDWVVVDSEGKRTPVEVRLCALPPGPMLRVSLIDITERNAMRRHLEETVLERTRELRRVNAELEKQRIVAERATHERTQFLATVSHDLRTPLSVMMSALDVLLSLRTPLDHAPWLRMIGEASETMWLLIGDILDASKLEAGSVVLDNVPFKLSAVFESVSRMMSIPASKKRISLSVCGSETDGAIEANLDHDVFIGDSLRIRQILLNLVSNAIKFTDVGGSVAVTVNAMNVSASGDAGGGDDDDDDDARSRSDGQPPQPQSARIRICVEDTGCGIPVDRIKDMFNMYTQSDPGVTRRHGGSGLGLYICRMLCDLMKGTIDAESELGKGSRFYVDIPLKMGTPADMAPSADVDSAVMPRSGSWGKRPAPMTSTKGSGSAAATAMSLDSPRDRMSKRAKSKSAANNYKRRGSVPTFASHPLVPLPISSQSLSRGSSPPGHVDVDEQGFILDGEMCGGSGSGSGSAILSHGAGAGLDLGTSIQSQSGESAPGFMTQGDRHVIFEQLHERFSKSGSMLTSSPTAPPVVVRTMPDNEQRQSQGQGRGRNHSLPLGTVDPGPSTGSGADTLPVPVPVSPSSTAMVPDSPVVFTRFTCDYEPPRSDR